MYSVLRKPVYALALNRARRSQSLLLRAMGTAFAFDKITTSRIKGASFTIEEGSKVGIAGKDDKAKIDILQLIGGTTQPISGSLEKTAEKKCITYSALIPKDCQGKRVEEYLESFSPKDGDGILSSESMVLEALDDASISTSRRTALISELGDNEKARLQLAAAIVQSPDVLLLDNPTRTKNGVFSDNDIKKMIEMILKFPKTCVVNSSDPDFLNSFSDNILYVSNDGRVELFIGSYTSAQNLIAERATDGEEQISNSDVRFALFLLFLLCPFEALLFFYYQ